MDTKYITLQNAAELIGCDEATLLIGVIEKQIKLQFLLNRRLVAWQHEFEMVGDVCKLLGHMPIGTKHFMFVPLSIAAAAAILKGEKFLLWQLSEEENGVFIGLSEFDSLECDGDSSSVFMKKEALQNFITGAAVSSDETPAQRKLRIKSIVDTEHSSGVSKTKSFEELAVLEKCSIENIKRIYYDKG